MRCSRGIIILVPLSTALVILVSITLFLSLGECPEGNFKCESSKICILQRMMCDGRKDCPNGEDEDALSCQDLHGGFWEISNNLKFQQEEKSCDLDFVPDGCRCDDLTAVVCSGVNFTTVPVMPDLVTKIIIKDNFEVLKVGESVFKNYTLSRIFLVNASLYSLPDTVFELQFELYQVFLTNNHLQKIPTSLVNGLYNLTWLFLDSNKLIRLDLNLWDLKELDWLDVSQNVLTLENESFPEMPSLKFLNMDRNQIEKIGETTFRRLTSLVDLSLGQNRITYIHPLAFETLTSLKELNLKNNELFMLNNAVFYNQIELQKLDLGGNLALQISRGLFASLITLKSLSLEDVDIHDINDDMFSSQTKLDFIYFKRFKYCIYVPHVPHCFPLSDGTSDSDDLIASNLLRGTLWTVALTTVTSNSLVLWRRLRSATSSSSPLNIVITHLAAADLLMGLYLLAIGSFDALSQGLYRQEASHWMSSVWCTILGVMAMVSCEVSLLILLLISTERFMLISAPLSGFSSLKPRAAMFSALSIWAFGAIIALLPVLHWRHALRFYGTNGFCFPLHIDEPFLVGWQYSAFVFLGLNSLGIFSIALLYIGVFISIWRTRHATTISVKDSEFALRFFFIVVANVCCWVPVIILKLLAFYDVNISKDVYGWLGVFVLPVNSAVNPVLYTFTTPGQLARSHIKQEKSGKTGKGLATLARTVGAISKHSIQAPSVLTPGTTDTHI